MSLNYMIAYPHGKYINGITSMQAWWTKIFAGLAYDMVKYRKFPILIPSYNNPNPPAVTGFLSSVILDKNPVTAR